MLIRTIQKEGHLWFEVCKEGLLSLSSFRNKKLRIIFNVSHQRAKDLEAFNRDFCSHQKQQQTVQNLEQKKNCFSFLQLSSVYEELSDNRVAIFLNAYENEEHPEKSIQLEILGYIVASVFFYHNEEKICEQSCLTNLLSSLSKLLEGTEIRKLENEIKFKSGFSKKPYFMCMEGQGSKDALIFEQFYKYMEGSKKRNEAVDMLIDYFPERRSLQIDDKQMLKKLKQEFIEQILGRQIFNFEITGLTLENLCFQLCELFNLQVKKIDLVKVYDKIITNQKMRVYDIATENYLSLSKQVLAELPQDPLELAEMHNNNIQRYVVQESIADASNCMDLNEYQPIYERLIRQIGKKYSEIKQENQSLRHERMLSCYEATETLEQMEASLAQITSESFSSVLEIMLEKLNIFIDESVPDFNTRDLLSRMIENYFESLNASASHFIEHTETTIRDCFAKIESLEEENKRIERRYLIAEEKCLKLEEHLVDLTEISNQYKKKISQCSEKGDEMVKAESYLKLSRRIRQLEGQIIEKDTYIEDLTLVLSKFDQDFDRKFWKPKFSKETQILMTEVSSKINEIHDVFDKLKKTEDFYQKMTKEFEKEKKKFDEERVKEKKQLGTQKAKFQKLLRQKEELETIIQEEKKAILNLKDAVENFKCLYDELGNRSAIQCGRQGQIEEQLEEYKKSLRLICDYANNGKTEKLKKYAILSENAEIRKIINEIIAKK